MDQSDFNMSLMNPLQVLSVEHFINTHGSAVLRSGALAHLKGVHQSRLVNTEWTRVHVVYERRGGRVVGTAMLTLSQDWHRLIGTVRFVVIHSEFRRKGLGRMLMEHVHEDARKLQVNRLELTSRDKPDCRHARKLCFSLGYQLEEGSNQHFFTDLVPLPSA